LEMVAKMLKVNENTSCIEFSKRSGDKMQFYDHFREIKKILGCVANKCEQI
jgi:translation initiation factor 2 alpha subunit (eIF-2alpha)